MDRIPRKRLMTLVAAIAGATACSSSDAAPAPSDRQPQAAPVTGAAAPVTTVATSTPAPVVEEETPARTTAPAKKSGVASAPTSEAAPPRAIEASDLANDVCDLDCQNEVVDGF